MGKKFRTVVTTVQATLELRNGPEHSVGTTRGSDIDAVPPESNGPPAEYVPRGLRDPRYAQNAWPGSSQGPPLACRCSYCYYCDPAHPWPLDRPRYCQDHRGFAMQLIQPHILHSCHRRQSEPQMQYGQTQQDNQAHQGQQPQYPPSANSNQCVPSSQSVHFDPSRARPQTTPSPGFQDPQGNVQPVQLTTFYGGRATDYAPQYIHEPQALHSSVQPYQPDPLAIRACSQCGATLEP